MGVPDLIGMIILNWIMQKYIGRRGLNKTVFELGLMAGVCKYDNAIYGFTKG